MRPVPKTARCCPGPCGSCCLANFHICTSASTSSLFLKPAAQCVTLSSSSEHQETIHSTRLTAEPSQPSWLHVNVDTAREMNRIGAIINFWCVLSMMQFKGTVHNSEGWCTSFIQCSFELHGGEGRKIILLMWFRPLGAAPGRAAHPPLYSTYS